RGAIARASTTGRLLRPRSRVVVGTRSQAQTPWSWSTFLAASLASFARVLVLAIPTQTGRPVRRSISSLILVPMVCSSSRVPRRPRNASSQAVEYWREARRQAQLSDELVASRQSETREPQWG